MSLDMKFILLALAPTLLITSLPKSASQPFSLSLSGPDQPVRVGSEVHLQVKLTNVSDRALTFFEVNRDCDYPVQFSAPHFPARHFLPLSVGRSNRRHSPAG